MKRRFRGLRNTPPRDRYDAVVIGAGVGGLVCANLLARDGLSVLLVEQHYMVGGYCSTFRRAGFTFDAATHFYPLLGNPESLTGRLLADLRSETRWVAMDPVDTFHLPDGSRFVVPADLETYRQRLDARFPAQRQALDRFFERTREAYLLGLLAYFRGRETPRFDAVRHLTLRTVLDECFDDPELKLILTADCPHWGSPPARTSFVFDAMLRLSYFLGNYYPAEGSQAFVDELARCFEARGGHVLMSTRAEKILVDDGRVDGGRVAGVDLTTTRGRLRGSHRVAAEVVVSNADLSHCAKHLLEPRHFDPATQRSLRTLRPSFPCFLTHLGVRDISAADLEAAQGYYWRSWDPDAVGRDGLIGKIFVPTLYEPRMAPDGGHVILLQKVLDMDWHASAAETSTDWAAHKAHIEGQLLDHLDAVLPGIRQKIVVKTSATARTSERFTLNQGGAMLGWEMSPEQLGDARPANEGPIPGLYQVGHWTRPGGGITPVMVSAQRVAETILRRSAPASLEAVPIQALGAAAPPVERGVASG